MIENIFIIVENFKSEYEEKNYSGINIKYPIKKKRILDEPFDLFVYEKKGSKLYSLKGLIVTKSNLKLTTGINIKFKNGLFNLKFVNGDNIEEIDTKELNNLYPKTHRKKLGNSNFSLNKIMKESNRTYYNILIDEENFNYKAKSYIKDQVLYDNQIIPLINKNKVYGHIINEMDEFIISLTNDKMLKIDLLFVENEYKEYKPYIYEIILDKKSNEKLKKIQYEEEVLYEILFIPKEEIYQKENEGIILRGELVFSASPFITKGVYIIFNENLVANDVIQNNKQKLFNLIIQKQNISNNANEINNFLDFKKKIDNIEVKIFDTGQANWIHIDMKDKNNELINKIVYDIGMGSHTDKIKRNNICSLAAKEIINRNIIFILSHWDLDHISGISQLEDEQFKTLWIVPELPKNATFSALRLAAYLAISPSITSNFISETCNHSVVFTSRHLTIGKGKGDGPNTKVAYTRNNNLGLVLRINNHKKALLTGDCEYNQLPNILLNQINNYEYLVVSHHGANIKQDPWQNYLKTSITRGKEAFVCVGKNRAYPKTAHIQLLNQNSYSITETRNSQYPYPIKFSI